MITSKTLLAVTLITTLGCVGVRSASAAIIVINPSKDNTLYEYDPAEGDMSNALGLHFFAGETGMGELRRGVVAFDIAGHIPPGSTITAVSLSMNVSRVPVDTAYTVELHKLLADWGEGTSDAPGEEGDGAPVTSNDATWRHRFFDTIFWTNEGGDFSATVSASQSVGPIGPYTWTSAQMIADVQSWLDNPGSNFGWLMLGDESTIATAKRFDTRESASPPVLTIQFIPGPRVLPTPRPRPTPVPGRRLSNTGILPVRRAGIFVCKDRQAGSLLDVSGRMPKLRQCSLGTPFGEPGWFAWRKCFSANSVMPRSWSRRPTTQW
jgi:hypothetical protein